jgi:hypothetical protein
VWSSSPEGACGSHAATSRSSSPVHGHPLRCGSRLAAAAGGIGGSHAAPSRRSSQVGACGFGHFCIWGFVFEQSFGHSFLNFGIWGFLTEQTRLLAAVVVAPPHPCGESVRWRGGAEDGESVRWRSDEGRRRQRRGVTRVVYDSKRAFCRAAEFLNVLI